MLASARLGSLCTSSARDVACVADGLAPPATRRADGGCGSIPPPRVVNDVPHRLLLAAVVSTHKRGQRHVPNLCRGSLAHVADPFAIWYRFNQYTPLAHKPCDAEAAAAVAVTAVQHVRLVSMAKHVWILDLACIPAAAGRSETAHVVAPDPRQAVDRACASDSVTLASAPNR